MAKLALITGATGLLGRQVVVAFQRAGWTVTGTGFTRASPPSTIALDLSNAEAIASALDETKPQVVVHCAANRFPDKCDADPSGTRALNITASSSLASLCAARSILLIYISTDYVFPGSERSAPYSTTARPSPPNLYGETKWEGEKAVLEAYNEAGKEGWGVVLRVPVLYGEGEDKESAVNVLMDVVMKAQEKGAKEVQMDHWAIRYPTNTEDVGRVLQDLATKFLETDDKASLSTTLHFSSEDRMTKYEICEVFAEIMGVPLDGVVPNAKGNEEGAKVLRPYDCHLDTAATRDLGVSVETMNFTDWWRRRVRAFRH